MRRARVPRAISTTTRDHKGWYVPRTLPHFDAADVTQAITFRLADSLPHAVVTADKGEDDAADRRRIAAALDTGYGECFLRDPSIAGVVEGALFHGAGSRYELFAWVIMPNHVHVLLRQAEGNRLSDTVHAWSLGPPRKSTVIAAAREQSGRGSILTVTYVISATFDATVSYIEENPVSAGLVARPEDWRYGSAWWRENGPSATNALD